MDASPSISRDVRDLFRRRDLRYTQQRERIYCLLADTQSHPTADQLFDMVRAHDPGISLATVYNTLDAFVDRGLARRITPASGGAARFDADMHPHAHLASPDGCVLDLPDDLSSLLLQGVSADTLRLIEQRLGVEISHVQVQAFLRTPNSPDSRETR